MNPSKIELPESLIKKLEIETNILNNNNGLIQGKNLIISEDKSATNKASALKLNNSGNTNNTNNHDYNSNSNNKSLETGASAGNRPGEYNYNLSIIDEQIQTSNNDACQNSSK